MFENVLGQEAAQRLSSDFASSTLPPALLFSGPIASGKGTTALELARVLSCRSPSAPWNCPCGACALHRSLSHPDLLLLGPRAFSGELAASAAAFLREPGSAARLLFLRGARKLLARFSSVLWEGEESKLGKAASLAVSLGEDLEEIASIPPPANETESSGLRKLVESALQTALKLESEGVADSVPISQVRRAAYWARLAPSGARKVILIENADRMQEGARNALLKILEEPPATTVLILSTTRRPSIMPTILSRVRTYGFAARDAETEREVIRRVFRDAAKAEASAGTGGASLGLVASYLDSFLPVSRDALDAAAAFFAASAAAAAVPLARNRSGVVPASLVALGRAAATRAEAAGMGRPVSDGREATAKTVERAGKFEPRNLFPLFLDCLLRICAIPLHDAANGSAATSIATSWAEAVRRADSAVGTYNQAPALALERLFVELTDGAARAVKGVQ